MFHFYNFYINIAIIISFSRRLSQSYINKCSVREGGAILGYHYEPPHMLHSVTILKDDPQNLHDILFIIIMFLLGGGGGGGGGGGAGGKEGGGADWNAGYMYIKF